MKFLTDNVVYHYSVAQTTASSPSTDGDCDCDGDEFVVELRYRKFSSSSSSSSSQVPELSDEKSLRFPRNQSCGNSLMAEALREYFVPENGVVDMVTHFNFYIERLSRRSSHQRGSIHVAVSLDAKEMTAERAAAIQRRMEVGREERRESRRRVVVEIEVALPARRSVVEKLEVVMVTVAEEECVICLEKMREGEEVIKLPCVHVYHKDCILRWLQRTHFCPFCRFKLPC